MPKKTLFGTTWYADSLKTFVRCLTLEELEVDSVCSIRFSWFSPACNLKILVRHWHQVVQTRIDRTVGDVLTVELSSLFKKIESFLVCHHWLVLPDFLSLIIWPHVYNELLRLLHIAKCLQNLTSCSEVKRNLKAILSIFTLVFEVLDELRGFAIINQTESWVSRTWFNNEIIELRTIFGHDFWFDLHIFAGIIVNQ